MAYKLLGKKNMLDPNYKIEQPNKNYAHNNEKISIKCIHPKQQNNTCLDTTI